MATKLDDWNMKYDQTCAWLVIQGYFACRYGDTFKLRFFEATERRDSCRRAQWQHP